MRCGGNAKRMRAKAGSRDQCPAESNSVPALAANSAAVPAPHLNDHGDTPRKFDRFSGKHFDIVFDGDSIMNRRESTGKARWQERHAALAADFGIEGDHVENVLWRLDHGQVDGVDPRVVMLMMGTNNSGQNSAEEIAEGIKVLVAEYEKRRPPARIILRGIFPRGEKATDGGRRKVAAGNSQIKALADGQRVSFIDISARMIEPDGTISRDMMPDFVHPTAKGWQIWADAIQPVINQSIPSQQANGRHFTRGSLAVTMQLGSLGSTAAPAVVRHALAPNARAPENTKRWVNSPPPCGARGRAPLRPGRARSPIQRHGSGAPAETGDVGEAGSGYAASPQFAAPGVF